MASNVPRKRRRFSDARWRANIGNAYDILGLFAFQPNKHVLSSSTRKKQTKLQTLDLCCKHISDLERLIDDALSIGFTDSRHPYFNCLDDVKDTVLSSLYNGEYVHSIRQQICNSARDRSKQSLQHTYSGSVHKSRRVERQQHGSSDNQTTQDSQYYTDDFEHSQDLPESDVMLTCAPARNDIEELLTSTQLSSQQDCPTSVGPCDSSISPPRPLFTEQLVPRYGGESEWTGHSYSNDSVFSAWRQRRSSAWWGSGSRSLRFSPCKPEPDNMLPGNIFVWRPVSAMFVSNSGAEDSDDASTPDCKPDGGKNGPPTVEYKLDHNNHVTRINQRSVWWNPTTYQHGKEAATNPALQDGYLYTNPDQQKGKFTTNSHQQGQNPDSQNPGSNSGRCGRNPTSSQYQNKKSSKHDENLHRRLIHISRQAVSNDALRCDEDMINDDFRLPFELRRSPCLASRAPSKMSRPVSRRPRRVPKRAAWSPATIKREPPTRSPGVSKQKSAKPPCCRKIFKSEPEEMTDKLVETEDLIQACKAEDSSSFLGESRKSVNYYISSDLNRPLPSFLQQQEEDDTQLVPSSNYNSMVYHDPEDLKDALVPILDLETETLVNQLS